MCPKPCEFISQRVLYYQNGKRGICFISVTENCTKLSSQVDEESKMYLSYNSQFETKVATHKAKNVLYYVTEIEVKT